MFHARLTAFFLLISILNTDLYSQKFFREGYVVKKSGETLEGLIQFNGGASIPQKIVFKRFDIAVEIGYSSDDISAFGYKSGKKYESVLTGGTESFLEVLVKGYISLYSNGKDFFVSRNKSKLTMLEESVIRWDEEYPAKEFRGTEELLRYLSSGNTVIKDKIDLNTELVPVIVSINLGNGGKYLVYNRYPGTKEIYQDMRQSRGKVYRFGLTGGMNIYTLSLSSREDLFLPATKPEISFLAGVTIERLISMSSDQLSVRADILYLKQTFYNYIEMIPYTGKKIRDDVFFDFSALKIPLQIQYKFRGLKFNPFINAGVSGMILLKSDYIHINEAEVYPSDIYISEIKDMDFSPAELSGTIGAGVRMRIMNTKTISFETRLEMGSGIFDRKFTGERTFQQHSIQPSILMGIMF